MLIETKEVTRMYQMGTNQVTALDHVSIGIGEGEFVSIQGTFQHSGIRSLEFT